MRIISYLSKHKISVLLIAILLIGKAYADLSIPTLTSDIVDVGIQQSGIEHVATEELSKETYEIIDMFLPVDDAQDFEESYSLQDSGNYALNSIGYTQREALDELMCFPIILVHNADSLSVANLNLALLIDKDTHAINTEDKTLNTTRLDSAELNSESLSLDSLKQAYQAGLISKESLISFENKIKDTLGISESILEQQGISAAKAELELLNYDMNRLQMSCLLKLGVNMLLLAALAMIIDLVVGFIASRTGAKIARDLREKLFTQVLSFSEAEINKFSAASLITRGTNDITLVQNVSIMLLRMVLYAPILAIGGVIMLMQTNASMGWIVLLAILCVFLVISLLFKLAMPKFKIMQKLIDRVNLVAREILNGMSVVRAFNTSKYEEKRFDLASSNLMKTQLFTNRIMTFMMPTMMLIMNLTSVAIVWFGGHYIDSGFIQTGDMIAFITYAMVIIMGFLMLGMISVMLPRADVAAERINNVLTCKPSIVDYTAADYTTASDAANGKLQKNSLGAEICFKHVSFKYDNDSACVLEDISFTAKPGETLAIIGATGSGKSTILKLIERFYDTTSGEILIDGTNILHISQHQLRAQIAYIPQKAFLFSGNIQTNIAYGNKAISHEEIDKALEISQSKSFVENMPEGIQSPIAQGGTNVSGGQRQRLAIARALSYGARILLFDDSFSALDYKTDANLRSALNRELSGVTRIIVAQRISTIMDAQNIVVLEDGHIADQGTHKELLKRCTAYQEIAYSQLSEEELKEGECNE